MIKRWGWRVFRDLSVQEVCQTLYILNIFLRHSSALDHHFILFGRLPRVCDLRLLMLVGICDLVGNPTLHCSTLLIRILTL